MTIYDPDAPTTVGFVHWIVFDIPAGVTEFPDGAAPIQTSLEGKNDFEKVGYGGPSPPPGHGPHRYFFEIYALDVHHTGLGEGASRAEVESKIQGHILDQAQLMGTYERQ